MDCLFTTLLTIEICYAKGHTYVTTTEKQQTKREREEGGSDFGSAYRKKSNSDMNFTLHTGRKIPAVAFIAFRTGTNQPSSIGTKMSQRAF